MERVRVSLSARLEPPWGPLRWPAATLSPLRAALAHCKVIDTRPGILLSLVVAQLLDFILVCLGFGPI